MLTLSAGGCPASTLAAAAQAQTRSGSHLPTNVPTLHQFDNAWRRASFAADQVECGAGALTASVPLGCLNTDWTMVQPADLSLPTFFRLGDSWAAGDKGGVDFWFGNGAGGYARYPVIVSPAGTVTDKVCNATPGALTPTASAFNVRVLQ